MSRDGERQQKSRHKADPAKQQRGHRKARRGAGGNDIENGHDGFPPPQVTAARSFDTVRGRRAARANFPAASDGPIIDQIAASDASISELRDIVAAKPGATQKPTNAIAPRHAIWINRETFISYVLICNILTT
jgi:hypothetical protein